MRRLFDLLRVSALAVLLVGGAGTISACNTVEGVGKDVDAAGKGITRGAKKVKNDL